MSDSGSAAAKKAASSAGGTTDPADEAADQPADDGDASPRRPVAPGGWPAPIITLIGLAAALIVLGGMRSAQSLLGPLFLAIVIAVVVHPLMGRLKKYMPGWSAITLTMLVTYTGVILFVYAIVVSLTEFAQLIGSYQAEFNSLVASIEDLVDQAGIGEQQIDDFLTSIDLNRVLTAAVDVAQGLLDVVNDTGFVLILLFFLLLDGLGLNQRFAAVAQLRPGVASRIKEVTGGVRKYLVVTTVFGAIVAAADVIFLYAIGIPLPLLWGLLAFVTGYIPTVGLIIGIVPPAAIALLDGGRFENGLLASVVVIVGYLVINNTIQNFIQPKFVGEAVGLSIPVSFLSLVVWTFVLGPLGAFLSIPMSLLARAVVTDQDPRHQWLAILASDRPPSDDKMDEWEEELAKGPRPTREAT